MCTNKTTESLWNCDYAIISFFAPFFLSHSILVIGFVFVDRNDKASLLLPWSCMSMCEVIINIIIYWINCFFFVISFSFSLSLFNFDWPNCVLVLRVSQNDDHTAMIQKLETYPLITFLLLILLSSFHSLTIYIISTMMGRINNTRKPIINENWETLLYAVK